MSVQPSPEMDECSDHQPRSRSNTTTSLREKVRPKSRGSTTSLQSIGVGNAFQPTPPLQQGPMPGNQHHAYSTQPSHAQQPMYNYQQDLALLQQQNVVQPMQSHQVMAAQARAMSQHDMLPTPSHGYPPVQPYPSQFQPPVGHWNMQPPAHMHIRHASEQYEGSPAPEDSNSEARRRKGGSSTLANDQELRRLLSQNQHRQLPEVASDVQKSEGSGGKSEKAKQIFAMLWLRENCVRSSQSVRRDRVFAKYTEKCGDMRVPTLNPASFGKLVRIIFPNVQTRRLGVRGESKYHYVDLSLVGGDDERQYTSSFDHPPTAAGLTREPNGSIKETQQPVIGQSSVQMTRTSSQVETADFPQPQLLANVPHPEAQTKLSDQSNTRSSLKLDCKYSNTATIRLPVRDVTPGLLNALPAVREGMPGTLSTYVAMPNLKSLTSPAPSAPDKPFELPDIHPYLQGQTYDPHMAKALSNLYRSYCIDVIDAFRKCKEKPFFSHHTAFNGKMTVPVAKLFNLECLAPWLHECDMRMYKQIISFLAPLAIQTVPDMVWMFFERVSTKLVPHVISTFEEKCPVHVVVAKSVPAARFTNLLKKLKDANIATLQLNKMLNDPQQRTQMWLDLMVMVEPDRLLDDSIPPAESFTIVQGILKHDLRTLIEPREGALVAAAEDDPGSSYAQFLRGFSSSAQPGSSGVLNLDDFDSQPSLLERWIGWLESLPEAFIGHHPQCMMDWHTKFWRSLMMQVGSGGAHSYQSWWYVEAFAQQMLAWMCEMQGMLMSEQDQKREDAKEVKKKTEAVALASHVRTLIGHKRNRSQVEDEDTTEEGSPTKQSRITAPSMISRRSNDHTGQRQPRDTTMEQDEPTLPEMPEHHHAAHTTADEDTDAEMDEITRGGPLDLPSIHTGLTSPIKLQSAPGNNIHTTMQASVARHLMQHHHSVASASMGDDSGIGLDLDDQDHDENLKEARKFNKRDWLLSSDPVDSQAGVGLGLTA
ncbi:hypothetical protein DV736_g769, partial [Chaetothyriales sp. CBS 134916]